MISGKVNNMYAVLSDTHDRFHIPNLYISRHNSCLMDCNYEEYIAFYPKVIANTIKCIVFHIRKNCFVIVHVSEINGLIMNSLDLRSCC